MMKINLLFPKIMYFSSFIITYRKYNHVFQSRDNSTHASILWAKGCFTGKWLHNPYPVYRQGLANINWSCFALSLVSTLYWRVWDKLSPLIKMTFKLCSTVIMKTYFFPHAILLSNLSVMLPPSLNIVKYYTTTRNLAILTFVVF